MPHLTFAVPDVQSALTAAHPRRRHPPDHRALRRHHRPRAATAIAIAIATAIAIAIAAATATSIHTTITTTSVTSTFPATALATALPRYLLVCRARRPLRTSLEALYQTAC